VIENMDEIHKLINHAKKNKDGFTIEMVNGKIVPVKGTKKSRYSVAGDTSIVYTPKDKYIKTYSVPRRNGFYGGWYDKETGQYLIEHVNLYGNKDKALYVARNRKQKAIFDLLKMNEIPLHYKERVSGIRVKRKHKSVACRSKNGYINRLTGRPISRKTAQRLNQFFKEHPNATLYEANKGAVYNKNKSWAEQPEKLYKVYKRKNQMIKTKNKQGKDVYFSPLLDRKVNKSTMKKISKFDYDDSGFSIHLYRITANKERIYHILSFPLKRTLEEHEDINRLYSKLVGSWSDNASRIIKDIAQRYPIGKRDVMRMAFNHLIFTTSYGARDNGAVTCFAHTMIMNANIEAMMPDEILKVIYKYHQLLNNYSRIFVKEVNITIFNFSNEKSKALAETRIGILRGN